MAPTVDTTVLDTDHAALHRLGFPRRHERRMGGFANFSVGFSCVGVLGGTVTLYGNGMSAGAPALIMWAWVVGGALTMPVALALAEVCSALPAAGSLHVYAAKLARRRPRVAAWWVGWLNACGQIALTAAVDFGAAMVISAFAELEWNTTTTNTRLFGIFAAVLVAHALLATLGGRARVIALARVSTWWYLLAATTLVAVLTLNPTHLQPPQAVFAQVVNQTGYGNGWSGGWRFYLCALALLMAAFTLTGFDASARVSEETLGASRTAPRGIVASVAASWLVGIAVLTTLTFAIRDYGWEAGSSLPAAQIMLDAVGRSTTAILLLAVLIAQLLCGLACIESSSRVLFAVSRDRILPGSAFWYRVSRRTRTPVNAVWLTAAAAALLAIPALWDTATFGTLAALAALTSGLAAIVPIYLRLRHREFVPGRWQLGRWSTLTGLVAVGWTALVSLALMAPRVPSVTRDRFDYLPVVLALVFILARIHWSSTAHGTRTPPRRGRPDEPGALDAELA